MQLFVIDPDPVKSARLLDTTRVGAILRESGQMLSMALLELGCEDPRLCKMNKAHFNHPCTLWVRDRGYTWTLMYHIELGREWERRRPKKHGASDRTGAYVAHAPSIKQPNSPLPFVNATTNHKHIEGVHAAYMAELRLKWQSDHDRGATIKFGPAGKPFFFPEHPPFVIEDVEAPKAA